jgi:molecular chaperone GrpE
MARKDAAKEETIVEDAAGQEPEVEESGNCDEVSIDLLQKIAELEAENSELKDRYLRKQADFENFRKRVIREKEESVKYANSAILSDLVTVIDDFERAIRSSQESKNFETFHSGIEMIEKQLVSLLERKYGLSRMECVGKEFDPELHEAIGMEENPDYEVQTVIEDYQRGYLLHDRVLRHAKVRVAVPVPDKRDDTADDSTEEESGGSR